MLSFRKAEIIYDATVKFCGWQRSSEQPAGPTLDLCRTSTISLITILTKVLPSFSPLPRGVSGQTREFDNKGNESKIDFEKMMKIVSESGYTGYIDVEYSGTSLSVDEGIKANLALIQRVIKPYNK